MTVETLAFAVGEPGLAYPTLNIWDLGMDNPTLTTNDAAAVPEPASAWFCCIAMAACGGFISPTASISNSAVHPGHS